MTALPEPVAEPFGAAAMSVGGTAAYLRVGRCLSCGYRFFPPQSYGCEACGAGGDRLETLEVQACGCTGAMATVHRHPGVDWLPLPFAIARIAIDEGPVLLAPCIDSVQGGAERVCGRIALDGEGAPHLLFEPVSNG